MSTLRKQTKKDVVSEEDIESLIKADTPDKGAAPRPSGAGGLSPTLLAKAIFRRVVDIFTAPDEADVRAPGGAVSLVKDVFLGMVLGLLTVSVLITLDYHDVIHLQSAHNFRDAAFALLNDPETLANVEDAAGLKFLAKEEYARARADIDGADEKVAAAEELMEKRAREEEEKNAELAPLQAEYDKLVADPALELDKWCGECIWGGARVTCDQRVKHLKDTYGTHEVEAKLSAMSHPTCKGG